MKKVVLAFTTAGLLASCGPEPLTEPECRALIEKEARYTTQPMNPNENDALRDLARRNIDKRVSHCVSSQTVTRDYYECAMDAANHRERKMCIDAKLRDMQRAME